MKQSIDPRSIHDALLALDPFLIRGTPRNSTVRCSASAGAASARVWCREYQRPARVIPQPRPSPWHGVCRLERRRATAWTVTAAARVTGRHAVRPPSRSRARCLQSGREVRSRRRCPGDRIVCVTERQGNPRRVAGTRESRRCYRPSRRKGRRESLGSSTVIRPVPSQATVMRASPSGRSSRAM